MRLKNAYIIKAESVVKDAEGNITEIHCSYDPDSRSGSGTEASMRKVKGTLHWVSIKHAVAAEARLYDRLFTIAEPDRQEDSFLNYINPESLKVVTAYVEPSLSSAEVGETVQFQRLGYFCIDADSKNGNLVFNKTVGLKDTWEKVKTSE